MGSWKPNSVKHRKSWRRKSGKPPKQRPTKRQLREPKPLGYKQRKPRAAAGAAVEKSDVQRRRGIREEQAANRSATRHADEQAAAETKAAERVREAAKQKKGSDAGSSYRSKDGRGSGARSS